MVAFYRIRDTKTGLFSSGGTRPRWSKGGKVWQKGPLKSHLRQHIDWSSIGPLPFYTVRWISYPGDDASPEKLAEYKANSVEYHKAYNIYEAKRKELESNWWNYLPENWEAVDIETGEAIPVRELR